jgi:hypothetical protein
MPGFRPKVTEFRMVGGILPPRVYTDVYGGGALE